MKVFSLYHGCHNIVTAVNKETKTYVKPSRHLLAQSQQWKQQNNELKSVQFHATLLSFYFQLSKTVIFKIRKYYITVANAN